MPKTVDNGKTEQILCFIRRFTKEKGFGPTIREIGAAVDLRSTSTVVGYLTRMTRAGLISSIPSSPRSIHVVEQEIDAAECADGCSVVRCEFHFPNGTYPMSVIAMVTDKAQETMQPVQAEKIEILRTETVQEG